MNDPTWISVLPPLLAIVLAIATRQVYLSLAGGIWLGWTILLSWNPAAGVAESIESAVRVLNDPYDAGVIMFTLVIGALIATLSSSGGVAGFVAWLERNRWVNNGRRAQLMAWLIGVLIFIESNITVLVAGSVSRPLFDRYRVSREKLAYLIDSTSAPICILIPLNAWGAYNLGILNGLGVEDSLGVFLRSILFNFYSFAAVILALAVVLARMDWGPMKRAEARAAKGEVLSPGATPIMDEAILGSGDDAPIPPRAVNMVVPVLVLVGLMPLGLWATGEGDLRAGDGSIAVLWGSLGGLAAAWILLLAQRAYSVNELVKIALRGAGGLVPLALILLLALALGDVTGELGTGEYVAGLTEGVLAPAVLLPLAFVVSAAIAFSIGSSWGTFAIMIPIMVPAAAALQLDLAPFLAAALSGGIFGDHCSPISDTTVISSMASATDHVDHVRTQLPYALAGGAVATVCFAVAGAFL
ncbi:MAG: C4-dicarboxylate ABC transporter [Gemmatimonadota bacterium]|nr:C4-dicarboxylate ABC transporter [Gemmatimonadota bacterium]MDE2866136.1 C4-dicarboxylate ABC transporter [Gemmatimonadota bacterium]MYB05603.1 C4-dicarboxylate ABC transporter [Gemmatimonadota bacterium]MYG22811.1 C4-dicarboxylate ABC transporter [Gemmatimonadota bacterium]MYJ40771.1 C4-dicarboxylate ABC transporter [Gemmatimonadota bacterium]